MASISAQELPSKWYFGKKYHRNISKSWCNDGVAVATDYGQALLRVVKADGSRPDINLFAADNKHQNLLGSYLKSCVNYLTIFGEPFGDKPADCGIDHGVAEYLRTVAERVVL